MGRVGTGLVLSGSALRPFAFNVHVANTVGRAAELEPDGPDRVGDKEALQLWPRLKRFAMQHGDGDSSVLRKVEGANHHLVDSCLYNLLVHIICRQPC